MLDTSTETIVVGPQGSTSALVGLDLIAKNVQINGPHGNGFTSQTAYVCAVGGNTNRTHIFSWLSVVSVITSASTRSMNGMSLISRSP